MSTKVAGCCFCESILVGASNGPWDTVIADTGGFVITPTKGSLIPGWLLVIGKEHLLCSGALKIDEFEALERAIRIVKGFVVERYGCATVFEHGPSRAGTATGCGIDHIHVHVAPLRFSLKEAVGAVAPSVRWESMSGLSQTKDLHEAGIAYGLLEEDGKNLEWCKAPKDLRQMFRRAIAQRLEIPDQFDYSLHPAPEKASETLQDFHFTV